MSGSSSTAKIFFVLGVVAVDSFDSFVRQASPVMFQ
jgi:hypothetical protein